MKREMRSAKTRHIPLADYVAIFDNSSALPLLVFEKVAGRKTVVQPGVFRCIEEQAGGKR